METRCGPSKVKRRITTRTSNSICRFSPMKTYVHTITCTCVLVAPLSISPKTGPNYIFFKWTQQWKGPNYRDIPQLGRFPKTCWVKEANYDSIYVKSSKTQNHSEETRAVVTRGQRRAQGPTRKGQHKSTFLRGDETILNPNLCMSSNCMNLCIFKNS